MTGHIEVNVGVKNADFIGNDHLVLQSAVDYVARMGGGTVRILPGVYEMGNSLFLRSNTKLIGSGDETVLRKCKAEKTPLAEDLDWYGHEVTVKDASIFRVGGGILLHGKSPHFDKLQVVKRSVLGIDGNRVLMDKDPRENFWLETKPYASTQFPVICGDYVDDVLIEHLAIDGNRAENWNLNGNYGGCVFIQDCNRVTCREVTARDYDGDGFSWQICHDVVIDHCRSINNADLGMHPGSGSQRPIITNNTIVGASQGLFFCWGVRHGLAENNVIEDCGKYGISIGHRDTDNVCRHNQIRRSGEVGIYFRAHPSPARDPHRNVFEENVIVDSGKKGDCIGVDMNGTAEDVVLRRNRIVDTRRKHKSRKRIGLRVGKDIKNLVEDGNTFIGLDENIV